MKKLVSYILAAIFIATSVLFFNSYFKKANAATEEEVYNATNTYAVKSIENKNISGYSELQYIVTYEMSNKTTDNIVASNPSVTVFTHGYNSSARDWMNNAEYIQKRSEFGFTYNEHSMINKVVELYGIDNTVLLVAKMGGYDSFELEQYVLERKGDASTQKNKNTFNIREQKFGKQYIIVFDSYRHDEKSSNDSNNNLYYQFNYMLSHVLYDIKQIDPAHRIPKVNLIGHSRGGLTNLQYALDHPDIVENLISIGTPYFGSTSVAIVQNVEDYTGDGLRDIINPSVYEGYRNTWNNGYENMYSKINAVAIGAYSTLPFLGLVAHSAEHGKPLPCG